MARISIVDSDQVNISSIGRLLKAEGHVLSFFTTSSSLISSLAKKQTDLIIIGVELDGEDGRELSKHLQTETPHKNIPVILTSPYYHTDSEIRGFCCDDLVSVPFEAATLTDSIEGLLAREQAKASRQQAISS
jgi:two-component system, sensor histidine kinase and response regulator